MDPRAVKVFRTRIVYCMIKKTTHFAFNLVRQAVYDTRNRYAESLPKLRWRPLAASSSMSTPFEAVQSPIPRIQARQRMYSHRRILRSYHRWVGYRRFVTVDI